MSSATHPEDQMKMWRNKIAAEVGLHPMSLPPLQSLVDHPGPVPKNVYNRGILENFNEVFNPRSCRKRRGKDSGAKAE